MTLPKQAIAFPEVAVIRKGTPKRKHPKYPNSWIQGQDLGAKFRIAFAPGTDDVKAAFKAVYPSAYKQYGPNFAEPDGFEMDRLRCMITTRNISEAWEWANEAYSAGRMIARADDQRFITLRNPLTGAYEVVDGEPYTEFKHGQSIKYERDGKQFVLPVRTYGRLSLFLPELGRMVRFTLKTTSFYDRLNISANLAAIQFLADTLNGGNAAGIPFYIYRREQQITWNKEDGSAQRIGKWLVCIEADPEWVTRTMQRMTAFALGGSSGAPLMLPGSQPVEISGNISPNDAEDEGAPEPDYGDAIDGETTELETEPEGKKPERPVQPPPTPKEPLNNGMALYGQRPYSPEQLKAQMGEWAKARAGQACTEKHRHLLAATLESALGNKLMRYELGEWLLGSPSTVDMDCSFVLAALKDWMQVSGWESAPSEMAIREAKSAHSASLVAKGQQSLPGVK